MHVTPSLLVSISKRLIPSVYGISRKGVHVQNDLQTELTSAGAVQVGEDAAFVSVGDSSRYHVCGTNLFNCVCWSAILKIYILYNRCG